MDYCKSCGTEVATGATNCPSCGDVIDEFTKPPGEIGGPLEREIRELTHREGKIEAVKRYREATGCDLKTSKDAVEQILSGGSVPGDHRVVPAEQLEAEVLELAQTDGKLAAIQRYRAAAGCGLKDAKEAVETLLQQHGVEARGGGCAGVALLLLTAGLGAGGWWLSG